MTTFAQVPSPIGLLSVIAEDGALSAVWLPMQHGSALPAGAVQDPDEPVLRDAARQLGEYFAGRRRTFELRTGARGTPFQQAVWEVLSRIPFGETWSYGDVARAIGRPTASRAVGAANGANPLAIIVPCHRVIGHDRQLRGYAGGESNKRWLLEHEASVCGLFAAS